MIRHPPIRRDIGHQEIPGEGPPRAAALAVAARAAPAAAGALSRPLAQPQQASLDTLLQLQRVIVNRAVGRRLARGGMVIQRSIDQAFPAWHRANYLHTDLQTDQFVNYIYVDQTVTDTGQSFFNECEQVAERAMPAATVKIRSLLDTLQTQLGEADLDSAIQSVKDLTDIVNAVPEPVVAPSRNNPYVSPEALHQAVSRQGEFWAFFRDNSPPGSTDANISKALTACQDENQRAAVPVGVSNVHHCSSGVKGVSSCSIWFTVQGPGIRIAGIGEHADVKGVARYSFKDGWVDPNGPLSGTNTL